MLSIAYPDVPSNRWSTVSVPAPSADRSSVIRVRILFGFSVSTSIVPLRSPPGVDTIMLPVVERDVSLPSAARPPTAARLFSTISSAVCAPAAPAQLRTTTASISLLKVKRMALILS